MNLSRNVCVERSAAAAPLFIRVPVGWHLIQGTVDNVVSWPRMLEFRGFLEHHGFPLPLACAVISVYAQLLAGGCYILGFQTRWAAVLMIVNFLIAIFAVHVAHGHDYPATFPAIMMLAASLFLLLSGPGRWSLDSLRRSGS
jgi:putative oxidoreductase